MVQSSAGIVGWCRVVQGSAELCRVVQGSAGQCRAVQDNTSHMCKHNFCIDFNALIVKLMPRPNGRCLCSVLEEC